MANIGPGIVWHVYTNDVPFHGITLQRNPVDRGKNGSGILNAPVFLRRVVWRSDPSTGVGDVIQLQDKNDQFVFMHTREADDLGSIERPMYGAPFWGLKLVHMDNGVLDLYVE